MYEKENYEAMKKYFSINWKDYLGECDINDMWNRFRNKLQEAIEKYIPCIQRWHQTVNC